MPKAPALRSIPNIPIQKTKLEAFVKRVNGIPADEAIMKADKAGVVIASNKRLDQALVGSEEGETIIDALPCWSGTMTAYTKPGQKFGSAIEYIDPRTNYGLVFPVHEIYRNEKDAILVAEHPDYTLEKDGKNRVVLTKHADIVTAFPAECGWYLTDLVHGIPYGNKTRPRDPSVRYFSRYFESRVGLVARGYEDPASGYAGYGYVVDIYFRTSGSFGVVVMRVETLQEDGPYMGQLVPRPESGPDIGNQKSGTGILKRFVGALGFG